ncbi:MAG TPA: hypothetical protein VHN17_04220 [Steroidobacteraceae bacterium]|jgi:hypothetical protein|nr:hypothetical protein [Steroidobacteraceae bacterium]
MDRHSFLIASTLLVLAGCSGTPTQHAATTPAARSPVVAGVTAAPGAADDPHAQMLEQARRDGYRVEIHSGGKFWCRQVVSVGSHISDTQCLTDSELEEQMRIEAQNREDWARSRTCGNMTCNGMSPVGK